MIIDIFALIAVLLGFSAGFSSGIIRAVFWFIGVAVGLAFAVKFTPRVTEMLSVTLQMDNVIMPVVGFAVTFFIVFGAIMLFARFLSGVLLGKIGIINKILGGLAAGFISLVLCSSLVWFGESTFIIGPEVTQTSVTYPYLKEVPAVARQIGSDAKPVITDFWKSILNTADQIENSPAIEKTESNYQISDEEIRERSEPQLKRPTLEPVRPDSIN